jgi:hypothetical protein
MAAVLAAWVWGWGALSFADDDDDDDGGGKARVEVTGQTMSFAPGDDGEIQAGVPFPKKRFKDTGKGTVKDKLTGLIWLKNANCFGFQTWQDALNAANNLADDPASTMTDCGLRDGSDAGDWRLPNVKELQSLIDFGNFNPALPTGHPFLSVQSFVHWSSTTVADFPDAAWGVSLGGGLTLEFGKAGTFIVWPVRGGQ